jgi:hypothetical protein
MIIKYLFLNRKKFISQKNKNMKKLKIFLFFVAIAMCALVIEGPPKDVVAQDQSSDDPAVSFAIYYPDADAGYAESPHFTAALNEAGTVTYVDNPCGANVTTLGDNTAALNFNAFVEDYRFKDKNIAVSTNNDTGNICGGTNTTSDEQLFYIPGDDTPIPLCSLNNSKSGKSAFTDMNHFDKEAPVSIT